MNLWKNIETGSRSAEEVFVVVETPDDSRNKCECNSKWNAVHQEKVLLAALLCPGEYAFIAEISCNNDDPLKTIVVVGEAHIQVASSTRNQFDCLRYPILAKQTARCFA